MLSNMNSSFHLSTSPLLYSSLTLPLSFWKKTQPTHYSAAFPFTGILVPMILKLLCNFIWLILLFSYLTFLPSPRLYKYLYRKFFVKIFNPVCTSKIHLIFIFLYKLNSIRLFFLSFHFLINYSLVTLESKACSPHFAEMTS